MRYAVHTPRRTLSGLVEYQSNGRRYATMQKAGDSVDLSILDTGPVYIHDTDESGYFKWFEVKAFHQLAGMEIESLDACPFVHPPITQAYWVHRDSAYSARGRKGISYHVIYGNPWTAVGSQQDEFDTLQEAVAYMRHHCGDDPIFRVKLERFDGEHSVKEIKS